MNLETLDVITYVCASLGILLFILCIVLVSIIIYGYCKRHCVINSRSYRVAPRERENDDIELAAYNSLITTEKNGTKGIIFRSDAEPFRSQGFNKYEAPIKKKLFWKNRKSYTAQISIDDSSFTEDELSAGRSKGFFRKKNQHTFKNRRLSKSDWYIYNKNHLNEKDDSDDEEHEALLYPNQVISLIGSPARESDLKQSQYFDALETIKEEQEEEEDSCEIDNDPESDSWTDLDDSDHGSQDSYIDLRNASKFRPRYPKNLPEDVKRRVRALKNLQMKSERLEARFYRELFYIEANFSRKSKDPIYDKRTKIINTYYSDENTQDFSQFWLRAMMNSPTLNEIIQIHDNPVLKFLKDIRISTPDLKPEDPSYLDEEHLEFTLQFHFADANPYFSNSILTKEYFLKCEPDPNLPFTFDGPEVITCRGCKIFWKKGQNVTLKPVKRLNKDTGLLVTKFAKRNSFFNFFTPPKHAREWILDPQKSALMEAHFNIGLYFKETFIPKSILFFGKDQSPSSFQFRDLASNKQYDGKKSEKQVSLSHRIEKANNILASSGISDFSQPSGRKSSMSTSKDGIVQMRSWYHLRNNISPNSSLERNNVCGAKKEKDPVVGKFGLVSSEGLDDYLKALGVGFARRKLAASITPTLVINIEDNGLYTVRTETNISTTELKFFLNEQFFETTLDGRNVQTFARRVGNTLILEQNSVNHSSKDTVLVREFSKNTMTMTMTVDGVCCKRVYHRVQD